MKMTDVALKESIKLISVIGDPAYEPRLRAFIKGPVKEEANRLIIFDAKPSKLQIKNINDDKNRVKDLLMDFHFKRNKPGDWETREVDPMQRSFGRKLDVRARTSADDIIDTLASDNPALMNNNSLLPKVKDVNGSPLNLEIANTVASQRRYYDKVSDSQFRNRGGDTRPLPPALIEMVIKKGNSRDPNSLQQSVNYSVLDILESGRGHSGNEQIDKYRDQIYNTMSNPFVRDIGEFVDKTVNKTKYGSLVDDKSSERRIVSDVLFGNNSEELWQ